MGDGGQTLSQDVDGMVDLLSLRVSERNNHPEILGRFFVLQEGAKLSRVIGELEQADFDFAVEAGRRNIDSIGDIGEAQAAQWASCRYSITVQAIGLAILKRRHDESGNGRDEATLRVGMGL